MYQQHHLFHDRELADFLAGLEEKAFQQVNSLPQDQFLNTSDDDIVAHISSQFVVEPLTIHEDRMTQRHSETMVDIGPRAAGFGGPAHYGHAIRVTVALPFTGDPKLWYLWPGSRITGVAPQGAVIAFDNQPAVLEMSIDHPVREPLQNLKRDVELNIKHVRDYVGFQSGEIAQYNRRLPEKLRDRIKGRRARLTKQDEIAQMLPIPLAPKDGSPAFKPLPLQKRIIHPLPPPPKSGFQPEPGIRDEDYENILSIISTHRPHVRGHTQDLRSPRRGRPS